MSIDSKLRGIPLRRCEHKGTVTKVSCEKPNGQPGYFVEIETPQGTVTYSDILAYVRPGEKVSAGEIIGENCDYNEFSL